MAANRTERRLKSIYLTMQALSMAILGITVAMLTSHSNQRAGIFRLTYDRGLDNDVPATLGSMYRCSGAAGKSHCVHYSTVMYLDILVMICFVISSVLNSLLVVKSSKPQFRIATAAFAFRGVGCASLSTALVFVLDSYFSALSALKPDADGKIQAGLVFWGNSVVNVTFAVVLLASDIVYRKATQNWGWSGAHYTVIGSAA